MALKDIWIDRVDGVDEASAEDINQVAHAVIENEDVISETTKNVVQNTEKINNIRHDYPLFSNAIKGSASGEIVALDDVSPIAHEMAVSVRGKNLIDAAAFRRASHSTTLDGDVFTTNFSENTMYWNGEKTISFKAGTYTVSVIPVSSDMYFTFVVYSAIEKTRIIAAKTAEKVNEPVYFTFTTNEDFVPCIGGNRASDSTGNVGDGVFSYKVQLEEGTTATPYAPYIADTSGVKVKALGKNLLDIHNRTKGTTPNGVNTLQRKFETDKYYVGMTRNNFCYDWQITTAEYADGVWSIANKVGGYGIAFPVEVKPNATYCVNVRGLTGVGFYDAEGNFISDWVQQGANRHFTTPSNCAIVTVCLIPAVAGEITEFSNCQLEVGTTVTEYEPYKEPVTYAQGEPINSIYPCTTLMTDTAGAFMNVTYNRDANKVVNELETRIAALEAAILN